MNIRPRIFLDFDGTITVNDVGYELFRYFTRGATEAIVKQYHSGLVNSLTCLSEECRLWNLNPPLHSDVLNYLEQQRLRNGFPEFLGQIQSDKIEYSILSEGFDFYIEKILNIHGLADIPYISNHAAMVDGYLSPSFPYFEMGCRQCSSCKGYHMNLLKKPEEILVFIGDGHSDLHACAAADIIFARSALATILNKKKYLLLSI